MDESARDEEMEGLEEEKKKIENYLFSETLFSSYSPPMRINDLCPVNLDDVDGALSNSEAISMNPFPNDARLVDEMDSFEASEAEEGKLSIDESPMELKEKKNGEEIGLPKQDLNVNSTPENPLFCQIKEENEVPGNLKEEKYNENESELKLEIKQVDMKSENIQLTPGVETTIKNEPSSPVAMPDSAEEFDGDSFMIEDLKLKANEIKLAIEREKTEDREDSGPPRSEGDSMEVEEGELEEGELEEDENQESQAKSVDAENEQNKENQDTTTPEMVRHEHKEEEKTNKAENYEKKEKSEHKKRKHKDKEDESKAKKRKHHFTAEEELEGGTRKKGSSREKSLDFDTLLKRQMYLVTSGSNSDNQFPPEEELNPDRWPRAVRNPNSTEEAISFLKKICIPKSSKKDGDSYESDSEEEWEDGPTAPLRRRLSRKRRGGSRSPSRKNEAICMFYLQGSCKRGGDCPYSHDVSPARKMELCKFYMMDCCAKREKCLYMHKDFPCKYYHFGIKCKDGDLCKFSHDPLQDITKSILLKHIELAPKDILGDFPRLSKHSAHIILYITEAKRNGEPFDTDNLEGLADYEGKGFRYLDRALKNQRKKKDAEGGIPSKAGEKEEQSPKGKEKEKEDKEKDRPKELSKIRDRENKEREKSTKKTKSHEKDVQRDYDKEKKDRNKERDNRRRERGKEEKGDGIREKGRRHERHRSDGVPRNSLNETPLKQKDPFAEMTPKQKELALRLEDRRPQDYDSRGSSDRSSSLGVNYPMGGDSYPIQETRWYSSDEEADCNRSPSERKESFDSVPSSRRQRLVESWGLGNSEKNISPGHGHPPTSFLDESNLSNIDFSYLKNVLSTVQSQTSQSSNIHNAPDERPNNWNDRRRPSSEYPNRERSVSSNYMDMNDIKEVFYDPPEPNSSRSFSRNIDSFIHTAREMSSGSSPGDRSFSKSENRESLMSRSSRDSRDMLESSRAPREVLMPNRDSQEISESINDPREIVNENYPWKQDERDIPDPRLKGANGIMRSMFPKDNPSNSDCCPSGLKEKDFGGDLSPNREKELLSKKDPDFRNINSIYDLGYGSQDSIQSPDFEESSDIPFKVPVHSSAKEIDASINPQSPICYRLVLVTVPKPDFSKLKINKNDPKTFEDPRLKRMLRRTSADENSRSPRGVPAQLDLDQPFGSPILDPKAKLSTKIAEIESRDPRKASVKDPRGDPRTTSARTDSRSDPRLDNRNTPSDPRTSSADPRADSWVDPRIDPRMTQRVDPRGPGGRMDPREVDPRGPGCRMDPRDIHGSDMRDTDPRVGGPVFPNGLIEGPNYGPMDGPNYGAMDGPNYGAFTGMGNISNAMMPHGIDPRGRPGLLGPGPSPNSMPMGQMAPSPFLLPSPIGHQGGHYMQRDRNEMMGGPGPNFSQGQGWGGGRSHFNDPRLGSSGDFSPSMS